MYMLYAFVSLFNPEDVYVHTQRICYVSLYVSNMHTLSAQLQSPLAYLAV